MDEPAALSKIREVRVPVLERPLEARVVQTDYRVIFGDTDAMGIVYYANYLRIFEHGRSELMRSFGVPYRPLFEQGILLAIVEQWWKYRAPAHYDDLLQVMTWPHDVGRTNVLVGCEIWREQTLVGQGACRLACLDKEGRVRRLPPEILKFRGTPEVV